MPSRAAVSLSHSAPLEVQMRRPPPSPGRQRLIWPGRVVRVVRPVSTDPIYKQNACQILQRDSFSTARAVLISEHAFERAHVAPR